MASNERGEGNSGTHPNVTSISERDSNNLRRESAAADTISPAPMESITAAAMTMTVTETRTQAQQQQHEVLRLTLRPPQRVTWDENVEDNEGLGRKSSKRCCIFHKQRPFGESSTDSSDNDSDESGSSSSSGGPGRNNKKNMKIARPKKKKVPDYQRYHA
eukprot:CAMPEP_0197446800 /NCGR_PEP_ID=MMETSP1175-20131217/11656_1 /TAXON_ID=1003142 /ORGANISM="Triceratium dubium, Strain CCMP147" /LENGTH=159 /DNA_ID=CAMNT_0042977963 /DNA_START=43 /DNA_END=522 /DNA_ORIENTATION=-